MKKVTVIGTGAMGTGLAHLFAEKGLEVMLYSRQQKTLNKALIQIKKKQEQLQKSGAKVAVGACSRIHGTVDLREALDGTDLISENVPEDLSLKQTLFSEFDRLASAKTIISTNTSGLPISEIAKKTKRPERVVGLHFINPPYLMPLAEVIRGEKTSDECMQATCDFVRHIQKHPIRIEKDVPGFLYNRLQAALLREALHIIEEKIASPADVDFAVQRGLAFRWVMMGPFRFMDVVGLEKLTLVAQYLFPELSNAKALPSLVQDKILQGKTGVEAGSGFHEYKQGEAESLVKARDASLVELSRMLEGKKNGGELS